MINVKIILINPLKKILLLHRENKPGIAVPNKWSFVGGILEKGETPEEAIIRETKEEIGCRVKESTLFKIYNDLDVQRYVFIGKIDKEVSKLRLSEGDDINYFTIKEALKLAISSNTRRYIKDYFSRAA